MKKLFIGLATFAAFSFSAKSQITFGLHGDVISTGITYKADDDENNFGDYERARISFRAGVIANLPLHEHFAFMPQINFLSGGGKIEGEITYTEEGEESVYKFEEKLSANFLEIPLNFAYTTSSARGARFFAGVGPVLQVGIGGKYTIKVSESIDGVEEGSEEKGDVKFDGKKADETDPNSFDVHFKRMNLGANIFAGYQLPGGLFFKANYTHGISNISPDDGESAKTAQIGIGIGYFFGKK